MAFPSGEVAIVGVYESPRRKAPGVHPFAIQAECILGALADAGLELGDVDGFATAASFPSEGGLQMSICEVAEYLAIHPRWFDSTDIGGAAFITHAGHAALAIAAGMADVVVVSYAAAGYSGIPEIPFADYGTNNAGPGQFEIPTARRPCPPTRSPRPATCTSSAPRPSSSRQIKPCSAGPTPRTTPTRASATRSRSPTCSPRR